MQHVLIRIVQGVSLKCGLFARHGGLPAQIIQAVQRSFANREMICQQSAICCHAYGVYLYKCLLMAV